MSEAEKPLDKGMQRGFGAFWKASYVAQYYLRLRQGDLDRLIKEASDEPLIEQYRVELAWVSETLVGLTEDIEYFRAPAQDQQADEPSPPKPA